MNRIFTDKSPSFRGRQPKTPFVDGQRRDAETVKRMLKEIAFVLAMTRRVKTEILEERQLAEPLSV